MTRSVAAFALATVMLAGAAIPANGASAKVFSTCKKLNQTYPHGVGLPNAHDHTKRASSPKVTNFTRNAAVYKQNKFHDTDHDGIACEKR